MCLKNSLKIFINILPRGKLRLPLHLNESLYFSSIILRIFSIIFTVFILCFVPSELKTIGNLEGVEKDYINFKTSKTLVINDSKSEMIYIKKENN